MASTFSVSSDLPTVFDIVSGVFILTCKSVGLEFMCNGFHIGDQCFAHFNTRRMEYAEAMKGSAPASNCLANRAPQGGSRTVT